MHDQNSLQDKSQSVWTLSAAELRKVQFILVGLGLYFIWALFLGFNHTLAGHHGFRQTMNASSVRAMERDGLSLDQELVSVGPPWRVAQEFPLYQYSTVFVRKISGLSIEQSGRLTSIFYFIVALTLLYFFLKQFLPPLETAIAVILTAISPLYLFWSRTFMLESAGVAAALAFGLVFWRYLTKPQISTAVLSVLLGVLAATIKPPTVLSVSVFAAGAWFFQREKSFPFKRALLTGLPVLMLVGFGTLIWQRYTKGVLSQLTLAEWMSGPDYKYWFFGHLPDRFSLKKWHGIKRHLFPNLLGYEWWLIFPGVALWVTRPPRLVFAALTAGLLPALIFFNIFAVHDYYWYETAFFFIIAVALCLAPALRDTRLKYRNAARIALVGIVLCSFVGFWRHYRKIARWNPTELRDFARSIRDRTQPNDVIVVYGFDWNPEFAYYMERLALQDAGDRPPTSPQWQKALNSLGGRSIGGVVVFGKKREDTKFVNNALKNLGFSRKVELEYEDKVYKRDHATVYLEKTIASGQ